MTNRSADLTAADARQALAAGDRTRARHLAQQALAVDATNEMAWLVLAALASGERRRAYLEHVLRLHPLSRPARAGLSALDGQDQAQPAAHAAPPQKPLPPASTQPITRQARGLARSSQPGAGTQPVPPWKGAPARAAKQTARDASLVDLRAAPRDAPA
ncbi:MAG: hypothetical protein NTY23_13250, partial [Chloroflexi bacterium]|nr:hypothetical protein [Chloroflexota bacterium]